MFDDLKEKLYEYIEYSEETDGWVWKEDAPKLSALTVLGLIGDLIFDLEENFVANEWFDKHYHTERDAVAREVKFAK